MANDMWKKVLGGAKVVLGAAFVYEGIKLVIDDGNVDTSPLNGKSIDGVEAVPSGNILKTAKTVTIPNGDIDKRLAYIQEKITNGSLSPRIKELTTRILTAKCGETWCVKEKGYKEEIDALFWALKDVRSPNAMRYQRDHAYVDQFVSAEKSLLLHGGDCDDDTILLGAMLTAAGYPVKARIIKTDESWSHIYLKAGIPPQAPTRWLALDLTMDKGPGWECPGAEEAQLTGAKSGIVEETKDYNVWKPQLLKQK
jgi:hypothetical protein